MASRPATPKTPRTPHPAGHTPQNGNRATKKTRHAVPGRDTKRHRARGQNHRPPHVPARTGRRRIPPTTPPDRPLRHPRRNPGTPRRRNSEPVPSSHLRARTMGHSLPRRTRRRPRPRIQDPHVRILRHPHRIPVPEMPVPPLPQSPRRGNSPISAVTSGSIFPVSRQTQMYLRRMNVDMLDQVAAARLNHPMRQQLRQTIADHAGPWTEADINRLAPLAGGLAFSVRDGRLRVQAVHWTPSPPSDEDAQSQTRCTINRSRTRPRP